jgi:hypothetical protein
MREIESRRQIRGIILIPLLVLFGANAWAQGGQAMRISGVVHGGLSGAPKAIEFYVLEDIEDLSQFALGTANNGSGTAGVEWTFPTGNVSAGEFLYVSKESEVFASFFGFDASYIDSGIVCNFNGDDAIELFQNEGVIDVFGFPDIDGTGTDWEYTLGWVWRSCESTGEGGFDSADWTIEMGAFGESLTNATAVIPFPAGEYMLPCIAMVPGCTESHADNFNPEANEEDGSCIYISFFSAGGCMYADALNFDADALFDDGSCEWSTIAACPADINENGLVEVSDVLLLLSAFGESCEEEEEITGTGQFIFDHYAPLSESAINVFYHIPDGLGAEAPVVMVFHGNNRNASDYRDFWIPIAEEKGLLIVAPEFSEASFPGSLEYMQGGVFDENGLERPIALWTFALLEPIRTVFQDMAGNADPLVDLWGHSAGAQFVHRFMLFNESDFVDRAVAANSGWYTVPDPLSEYPYGLVNSPANGVPLEAALGTQLLISLGTEDNNTTGPIHNPEVDEQGLNRYDRGHYFETQTQITADFFDLELNWYALDVEGVGHAPLEMAEAAAIWLFP